MGAQMNKFTSLVFASLAYAQNDHFQLEMSNSGENYAIMFANSHSDCSAAYYSKSLLVKGAVQNNFACTKNEACASGSAGLDERIATTDKDDSVLGFESTNFDSLEQLYACDSTVTPISVSWNDEGKDVSFAANGTELTAYCQQQTSGTYLGFMDASLPAPSGYDVCSEKYGDWEINW